VTQPYDAEYWRRRVEEARAIARAITLPIAQREMEYIAAAYERLAERAGRTAGRRGAYCVLDWLAFALRRHDKVIGGIYA
jgi:hypothetical protein